MQDEYRIAPFDASKLTELHSLMEIAFNRRIDLTLLRAKYDTAYTGYPNIGFIAYDSEGKPVGYYGLVPIRFRQAGKVFWAGHSVDSAVHPQHQGKGLLSRLLQLTFERAKTEGMSFAFGFPNENSGRTFIPKYYRAGQSLQGLLLPVSKLPWMRALLRLPKGAQLHAGYCHKVLPLLSPSEIPFEFGADARFPQADRSLAYFSYKSKLGAVWVNADGVPAWIHLRGGQMLVGEISSSNESEILRAVATLRKFARRCGCESIVWFSIGHPSGIPANWRARPLPEWPTHFADLDGRVDLTDFRLSFSDLDSF